MSLVEQQARDRLSFIPNRAFGVEEQEQKSYTSSRSSFPQSSSTSTPSDTDISEIETKMAQFNKDVLFNKDGDSLVQAPALPPRSTLRASRLLGTMPLKLSTEERPVLTHAAPHILYLSSEEDASSSSDDFSDCEYSSDSEEFEQTPVDLKPLADTARLISVIFSGKPSVVQVARRTPSPSGNVGELLRTSTEPVLVRKGSTTSLSQADLPPRSSSMLSTINMDRQRHSFLTLDPFAQKTEAGEAEPQPRKTANMFQRTLSLVRKRSRPNLYQAAMQSRESLSIPPVPTSTIQMPVHVSPMAQVGEQKAENHMSAPRTMTLDSASHREPQAFAKRMSYSKAPSVVPPSSPSPTKRIRPGFLTRRRTIKA